jgi:hypothetical protein
MKVEFDEKMEVHDIRDRLCRSQTERTVILEAKVAQCSMKKQAMQIEGHEALSEFIVLAPPWKQQCEHALNVIAKFSYSEHTAWRSRVKVGYTHQYEKWNIFEIGYGISPPTPPASCPPCVFLKNQ